MRASFPKMLGMRIMSLARPTTSSSSKCRSTSVRAVSINDMSCTLRTGTRTRGPFINVAWHTDAISTKPLTTRREYHVLRRLSLKDDMNLVFDKLSEFADYSMWRRGTPGMVLGITDRGKTLFTAAKGFADVASGRLLSTDSLFQIGSVSKSFTCIALLQLVEQGVLDIHKPVREYLPWLSIRVEILRYHVAPSHDAFRRHSDRFRRDPCRMDRSLGAERYRGDMRARHLLPLLQFRIQGPRVWCWKQSLEKDMAQSSAKGSWRVPA